VGYADFHEMLCVDYLYSSENGHNMCWVGNVLFSHDLYDQLSSHLTRKFIPKNTIFITFSLISITDNFRSHNPHLRKELITVFKI
jgi:hypothetical protein